MEHLTPWDFQFGGDWQEIPAVELNPDTRDAIGDCRKYWPDTLGEEIATAMASSGAWYFRSGSGETVYLYAPEQRLAARVRFGD